MNNKDSQLIYEVYHGDHDKKEDQEHKDSNEDLLLPADKKIVLKADTKDTPRGLIVTWKSSGGYDVAYWYETPDNVVPAELKGDGKDFGDIKKVFLGFHPELGDKEDY